MKRDTLLDFLTQRSSPGGTLEFQRVLADLTKEEKADLILDIINESRSAQGISPDVELPGWLKKIGDSKSNQAKQVEKIIDMSPADIENLFKVMKSPSNAELLKKLDPESQQALRSGGLHKDAPLLIDTTLSPRMLSEPLSPETIQRRLLIFQKKNPDVRIEYSQESYGFVFEGTEEQFDQLAAELKITPTSSKFMKEGKSANFDLFKQQIFIKPEGDGSHLIAPKSPEWVAAQAKKFQKDYRDVVKKADYNTDTHVLEYHGPKNFLPNLLRKLGVKPEVIEDYERKSELNSGIWELRFMPFKAEDYLTSWMEGMDARSPKLRDRWEKAFAQAQAASKKAKNFKMKNVSQDPEENDWVLRVQGTLLQVKEVLEVMFDKKLAETIMKEFVPVNYKFKVDG